MDRQLSQWAQHQGSCRQMLLRTHARERWRPPKRVLSPTLFLLHINNMLEDSSIHCYADDSTVDAIYSGRASLYRENSTTPEIILYLQFSHSSGLFPSSISSQNPIRRVDSLPKRSPYRCAQYQHIGH